MDGFSPLSVDEVNQITKSVNPEIKEPLQLKEITNSKETILNAKSKVLQLINTSIITYSINKLKENATLSSWVEKGLEIHRETKSESCEFCGQSLLEDRLIGLEKHFNNEFIELKERLMNAQNWINDNIIILSDLPRSNDFYEEFKEEYLAQQLCILEIADKLNRQFNSWSAIINQKLHNPFEAIDEEIVLEEEILDKLYFHLLKINLLIDSHNKKTENFNKELSYRKKQLEVHFALEAIKSFKFFTDIQNIRTKY